jgi:hypothetical protein
VTATIIGINVETFSLAIISHKQYRHSVKSNIFNEFLSALLLTLPVFFPEALRPNTGHGLIIPEVSRLHTHTHVATQLVGLLWRSERSAVGMDLYLTTYYIHNSETSMPRWDSNPQSPQASDRKPNS